MITPSWVSRLANALQKIWVMISSQEEYITVLASNNLPPIPPPPPPPPPPRPPESGHKPPLINPDIRKKPSTSVETIPDRPENSSDSPSDSQV